MTSLKPPIDSYTTVNNVSPPTPRQIILEILSLYGACTDEDIYATAMKLGLYASPAILRESRRKLVTLGMVKGHGTVYTCDGRACGLWIITDTGKKQLQILKESMANTPSLCKTCGRGVNNV